MTGLVGAVAEAWGEVRVHKSRVVLSLIGVFFAVLAMTTVTALGQMTAQAAQEQNERYGGRPATLAVQPYDSRTGSRSRRPVERGHRRRGGAVRDQRTTPSSSYDMGLYRMPGGTQQIQTTPGSARPMQNCTGSSRSRAGGFARPTGRTCPRHWWSTRTSWTQLGVADLSGRTDGGDRRARLRRSPRSWVSSSEDLRWAAEALIGSTRWPGRGTPAGRRRRMFSSGPPSLEWWVPDAESRRRGRRGLGVTCPRSSTGP